MSDRHSGRTEQRRRALDSQQAGNHSPAYGRRRERQRSPMKKLIPFLFIAIVGMLIAREEVPAVGEWWERTFSPDSWRVKNACKQAVIDGSGDGKYLRVLETGQVHVTTDGPYVEKLVAVELGASGAEQTVEYTCYLDKAGKLFKLNRRSAGN